MSGIGAARRRCRTPEDRHGEVGVSAPDSLGAKDPEERRRRILAAAVEVLIERGFAGTRVADIATVAGTSPALIVYHFGSLDGVLAEAVRSVEDDFFDDYARLVPPGADAVERLRLTGVIGADVGPAVGNWVLWMEIWVRALRDEGTRAIRQSMDARWRGHICEVLEAGVAEGVFTCADPEASAVRLVAVLDGLAVQVSLGDPAVPEDRMTDLWLDAAAVEVGLPRDRFLA
jgi:AcrR family transcriptional regulator